MPDDKYWNSFPFGKFEEIDDYAPYMNIQRHVPMREVLPEIGSALTLEFIPESDGIRRQ